MSLSKWRDISEAPKDGTLVDLWVVSDKGGGERAVDCAWYDPKGWLDPSLDYGDGEYISKYGLTATHFMPLPDPPS